MSKPTQKSPPRRTRRKEPKPPSSPPPIICARCGGPVIRGQHVEPLFLAKLVHWSQHPVLSKPLTICGII
jgi:hypothetical protein